MTEHSRERAKTARRPSRDPETDAPLNAPDVPPEQKGYQMAGERLPADQGAVFDAEDIDDLGELTRKDIDEDELIAEDADRPEDPENLELLTELELRAEETDDPMEAVEEGLDYVPPIDPPVVPGGGYPGAEVASGFGVSALDEEYDQDHHSAFTSSDDEISARVREALRADSSTTAYADRLAIESRGGVVTLRGVVADLLDSDNLLAVAEYVEGVDEVVDELQVRGLE
jgi:BON domain